MSNTQKIMKLDLSAERPDNSGYYYAELALPAKDYEIRDAVERIRAVGREDSIWIDVLECGALPALGNVRLESPTIDELNFFAKRLASLTDEDKTVFDAIVRQVIPGDGKGSLVGMRELINSTYGLDSVNELLTDEGILQNGSKFENISVFQQGEATSILFPFEDSVQIDMGKLAMWRIHLRENFGGTWLSDYVENRLGGFVTEETAEKKKPDCKLIGEDGNIFNLIGIAARTLRRNDMSEQANEMCARIHASGNYDEALSIIGEYVNITGDEDSEDIDEGMDMQL